MTNRIETLQALKQRGARYLVRCRYAVGQHQAGEVVSWHKSHHAACTADARIDPSRQHFEVVDINDALSAEAEFDPPRP